MGARENLERMLALADQRLAQGQLVNTPEQVAAQEAQRYTAAIFPGPSGEFEPVRNRKLRRQKPYYPSARPKPAQKSPPKPTPSKPPKNKRTKAERHWAQLKASVIAERGRKCETCGDPTDAPFLTRLTWRRKGRELHEDVRLLCRGCFDARYAEKVQTKLDREYQDIVRETPTDSLQVVDPNGKAPWED